MLKKSIIAYKASFSGLSKEVWWLALVTFINRAGTMVIPFLSLYLTDSKGFSLDSVGWIMTSFGFGSILGAWLGGKLTDKFGYYKVIHFSLILAGIFFFTLQFIDDFWMFCLGLFAVTLFADMFRPAMYVALNTYSKPENKTRSVTLVRLAINLGFSFGPAAGGLIIATMSYSALFWIDSITCLLASLIMFFVLKERIIKKVKVEISTIKSTSPYKDKPYLLFLFIVFLGGFMFIQLFTTLPLYFKNIHGLSESQIGWLMSANGLLIFILEMPLISYLENKMIDKNKLLHSKRMEHSMEYISAPRVKKVNLIGYRPAIKIITIGNFLIGMSFLVLNFTPWVGIIIFSIVFITVGEMLAFPFANSFAMTRAKGSKQGEYIALFPVAFGLSHITASNIGMQLIGKFSYDFTWYFISGVGLLSVLLGVWLMKILAHEKIEKAI